MSPRRLLASLTCAAALVGAAASTASAAPAAADLLAPASVCPNQTYVTLPPDWQQGAMGCMIAYARNAVGVRTLARDADLMDAAARKGRDMFACGEFSHSACGLPFTQRMEDEDYDFRRAGENLAFGVGSAASPRAVMAKWLASPAHRANLLNPAYREHGIALAGGTLAGIAGARVWVDEFGTPR
jgi:uncharacterized protein YkwD